MHNRYVLVLPLVLTMMSLAGTQFAYATNESSYQYGFHYGFSRYKEAIDNSANVDFPGSNLVKYNPCMEYKNGVLVISSGVTNQTACIDGYVNGWKAWCKTDMNDCLEAVLSGDFPDAYHQLKPDAGFPQIPQ
jgi:hypothetical protein